MDKAITVVVEEMFKHPRYEKYVRKTKSFKARDAHNVAQPGDLVEIEETRPLSRTMHWRLVRVVKPATLATEPETPAIVSEPDVSV